ncbi:hypothetical protein H5410_060933 [Solanum commersonii]|uniref:Uncharacterized protein n=1 Tax=Solanum commersonii TaxID=4109 RepID=A0A9J5W749_SOLCO|nr:hypothetical protein H5410_060933 [Solanum commersonii]
MGLMVLANKGGERRALGVSLTTFVADITPLLSSCTWYNKKRINRNQKAFTQNSTLIPTKEKYACLQIESLPESCGPR